MYDFTNKRVAVIGMARSGLAAAEVLNERGAIVTLYDSGAPEKLTKALAWAADHDVEAHAATEIVRDSDLVITSPGVRKGAPVLLDAVSRGIPVWGEIEAAYVIARAPILAITGTNGKTTTTALLGAMTEAAGYQTFLAGNIAAGEISMPLIRAAHKAGHDAVIVAEISSFQLEWAPTFRPKVAAILNITVDHADRQTWDEYVAAKWNIFANQGEGDTSVLRSDVPLVFPRIRAWDASAPGVNAAGFSNIVQFDQISPKPEWTKRLLIPGAHNVENAMAACAMAHAFGIDDASIEKAATTFTGVVHRMEYVATVGGVRYINNSMCTNNAAFARSLDAVEGPAIVIAGGVYKGGDMSDLLDAATRDSVKRLVLFGKSAPELEAAVRERGVERVERVVTIAEAVAAASRVAESGDTVVLSPACASFDQFRDFEDRGDTFKRLVHELG